MPDEGGGKSLDILGIKPIADAALIIVKGTVDGAGAFLGRICLPAAEEFGLLLRDKVSNWRSNNAVNIISTAEQLLIESNDHDLHAHPRIVSRIIDQGSWEDNEQVQKMWAGLLASACTRDGRSQGALIFINLLEQLTSSQAILLDYACRTAIKKISKNGLILAGDDLSLPTKMILDILGTHDIHQADVELDHLREIGLLSMGGGFHIDTDTGDITPSALALNFYARCQGHRGLVTDFFHVESMGSNRRTPHDPEPS